MPHPRPRVAVILAAGKGTRMKSSRPKVLHEAAGRPLLAWVIDAARAAGCGRILVVVGHGAGQVRETIEGEDLRWVIQAEQRGTGHALAQAESEVDGEATVLVLSGDVPLMNPATLEQLVRSAEEGWGAMAVAELEEPGSLGRVIVDESGAFRRIVEARDADPEELAVRRINAGLYALPAPEIFEYLRNLKTDNAQGELYLTDAVTQAAADGRRCAPRYPGRSQRGPGGERPRRIGARPPPAPRPPPPGPDEGRGDHPGAGADGDRARGACGRRHSRSTPECLFSATPRWAGSVSSTRVPGCGTRAVEDGATIEPYSVLDGAEVGEECRVGPFARLRPASRLLKGARVGNFVEVKNSQLGAGAKANHLAYLGDATVGEGANIGAGAVTCNYDGVRKHPTEIGRGAFIGSDTMLVAPVKIGEGATTAAGSIITKNVPDGALAVGRVRQKNLEGWAGGLRRRRERKKED